MNQFEYPECGDIFNNQNIKAMTTINPYLTFNGNCEEAFNFYKSVFGGEFAHTARFKEMPPMEGCIIPESDLEKIMHVSLPISNETVLMGCDSSEAFGKAKNSGDNFAISINTKDIDEAKRIFNGLSKDGHIIMPMDKTFWDAYYGMFVDKFGIQWMVNCELQEEEK